MDAAVGESVAHAVGEDGFGFDAWEYEREAAVEEGRVECAWLDETESAADPERRKHQTALDVIHTLMEELLGAAWGFGLGQGERVGGSRHHGLTGAKNARHSQIREQIV